MEKFDKNISDFECKESMVVAGVISALLQVLQEKRILTYAEVTDVFVRAIKIMSQ
jgi:hypothetical protein